MMKAREAGSESAEARKTAPSTSPALSSAPSVADEETSDDDFALPPSPATAAAMRDGPEILIWYPTGESDSAGSEKPTTTRILLSESMARHAALVKQRGERRARMEAMMRESEE